MADDRSFLRGVSIFMVSFPDIRSRSFPPPAIGVLRRSCDESRIDRKIRPWGSWLLVLVARSEESARNELLVGRDHMIWNGGHGAVGVGVPPAEVPARAHEHMDDGLELCIAEAIDGAGVLRAPQDTNVGRRNIIEMFLVTDRRKKLSFVENAQAFPALTDEVEERTTPFDLLP